MDFLFEQGISKAVKSGYFNFENRKEIKIRSMKIIVYEHIGVIGVQEKYTFKYFAELEIFFCGETKDSACLGYKVTDGPRGGKEM